MMWEVRCVWPVACSLGEAPFWHEAERCVYFVDIKGKRLHCWRFDDGARQSWGLSEMPGWVIPCHPGPGMLAGLQSGIACLEFGDALRVRWLHRMHAPGSPMRLNDAKVDPHGNLWFGSMDGRQEGNPVGMLYRLDRQGSLQQVDTGYGVTNGPTFSPDGRILYHTDSSTRTVYAFDLAPSGALSNKRVWHKMDSAQGYPDGMTVDSEGCLWIAHWDAAMVTRWSPDANWLATFPMPVRRPTSVCFGGPDYRSLFITSALDSGTSMPSQSLQQGGLFVMKTAITGLPAHPWAGKL